MDLVLCAVRRRKSARGLVSSVGMGSEIVGRLSSFCGVRGVPLFGFCALPVQPTHSNTASAPMMMPGIRPAMNGKGGKGLHVASSSVELLLADRAAELLVVVVGLELEDDDAVELDEELLELAEAPGKAPAKRALDASMLHWKVSSSFLEQL